MFVGVYSTRATGGLVSSLYALDAAVATRHAAVCDCLAHRYGNAGDRRVRRRAYPTDLTDAQWATIVPLVPVPELATA